MTAFDRPITLEIHGIAVALFHSKPGEKGDAIGKSHKSAKAHLERCRLGRIGGCGRAASLLMPVFFL